MPRAFEAGPALSCSVTTGEPLPSASKTVVLKTPCHYPKFLAHDCGTELDGRPKKHLAWLHT